MLIIIRNKREKYYEKRNNGYHAVGRSLDATVQAENKIRYCFGDL